MLEECGMESHKLASSNYDFLQIRYYASFEDKAKRLVDLMAVSE
jgi:hypothetical protein